MGKFFKYATSFVNVHSMDELWPLTSEKEYAGIEKEIAHKGQPFPPGKFLQSNYSKKYLILQDPSSPVYKNSDGTFNQKLFDMVQKHELTHAIRSKNNNLSVRMYDSKNRFISGLGVFAEELAAQRRMVKGQNISLKRKVLDYIYPVEAGIGKMINKNVKFKNLRNIIKGKI